MVAAFCEVIRNFMKRIKKNTQKEVNIIYQELKDFESELIYMLIDDSQWLHKFTEAHLLKLKKVIK